jgi:multicomponent Na+:H+ antiporter subunit G
MFRDVVAGALLIAGSSLALVAGIGIARFPDLYARMHAATKPATLGLALCAAGAAMAVTDLSDTARLALLVGLQFLTAPVGAHLIGRAAYPTPGILGRFNVIDELAATHDDDEVVDT